MKQLSDLVYAVEVNGESICHIIYTDSALKGGGVLEHLHGRIEGKASTGKGC